MEKEISKLPSNERQEVEKFISLLYMNFKNYTTITELNISNASKIYDVDERIIDVLIERGAVRDISKNGKPEYKWNTIPPTSVLIEDIYLELIGDAPLPTIKQKDVNKQPKVMKKTKRKMTQEDIDYIAKTIHKPAKPVARKLGRTKTAIWAARGKIKNGIYTPTGSTPIVKVKSASHKKKVTQLDIDYVVATMEQPLGDVSDKLGRTRHSIEFMRTQIKKGKVSKGLRVPSMESDKKTVAVVQKTLPFPAEKETGPFSSKPVSVPRQPVSSKAWKRKEIIFLKRNIKEGQTDAWIAGELGRTEAAVKKRRWELGLRMVRSKHGKATIPHAVTPKQIPSKPASLKFPRMTLEQRDVMSRQEKMLSSVKKQNVESINNKQRRIRILWGAIDIQF